MYAVQGGIKRPCLPALVVVHERGDATPRPKVCSERIVEPEEREVRERRLDTSFGAFDEFEVLGLGIGEDILSSAVV